MPSSNATGTPAHPGMTITVYKVDPTTGARSGQQTTTVQRPSEAPPMNSGYPPCECPRHREGRS